MVRTILQPATGTCQWVGRAPNGAPLLRINEKTYEVHRTDTGYAMYTVRFGEVVRYEVVTTWGSGWTCDCPDATNRAERADCCKHIRALKAALATKNEDRLFQGAK